MGFRSYVKGVLNPKDLLTKVLDTARTRLDPTPSLYGMRNFPMYADVIFQTQSGLPGSSSLLPIYREGGMLQLRRHDGHYYIHDLGT